MWLWGYYGKLGHCTSLEAELWAIYKGLTILFQKGVTNVEIESDSAQAISNIQQGPTHNSPFINEDAKFLLNRCNCSLGHTMREGNKVAGKLANLGVAQDDHVVILEDSPEAVRSLLIDDMTGNYVVRD
ncbi:hypothetical protein ACSBR2_023602 [Camellia fascicularis]